MVDFENDGAYIGSSYFGTDRICPVADVNSCAVDFKFGSAGSSVGFADDVSGVLGLSSGQGSEYDWNNISTQFMEELNTDSNITEMTFSLYLTDDSGSSYIDFGAPNTSVYTDPVVTIDIEEETEFWASKVTGLRWGASMNDLTEYKLTEGVAAIRTIHDCISGP